MDNIDQNITENTAGSQQEPKTFTQEDVDKIIGQRLARERQNYENNKSAELAARELKLDAREKLAAAGLAKEYIDVINCSSADSIDKSIKALTGLKGGGSYRSSGYRVSTSTSSSGNHSCSSTGDDIRKAMGLR